MLMSEHQRLKVESDTAMIDARAQLKMKARLRIIELQNHLTHTKKEFEHDRMQILHSESLVCFHITITTELIVNHRVQASVKAANLEKEKLHAMLEVCVFSH